MFDLLAAETPFDAFDGSEPQGFNYRVSTGKPHFAACEGAPELVAEAATDLRRQAHICCYGCLGNVRH